jgi:signal transduction histidine kinase
MLVPGKPPDEAERLKSLEQHDVLDSSPEVMFDEITDLAAAICEAPMALITFVDKERVWFKSKVGISRKESSRDVSFCSYAILQKEVFVVPDTARDERFKNNPLVVKNPKIRFYAGSPLVGQDGQVLGMMCVLARKPRRLRRSQRQALRMLARLVMIELELRRSTAALQQLEMEAANLRLVRAMADRLLHEIGNAMVPLSIHQQLLTERYSDPDYRVSLDAALTEGNRRVSRLINQMRYLAQETEHTFEPVPLQTLVKDACQAAVKIHGAGSARFHFDAASGPILIQGEVAALTHAFAEVILNALQANPGEPRVEVHCTVRRQGDTPPEVVIHFRDRGNGFSPEVAKQATRPFFTTRSVGPGLGLYVARTVVEKHHGRIEIHPSINNESSGVQIHLPLPSNGRAVRH